MTHLGSFRECPDAGAWNRSWRWSLAICALFLFIAPRAFAQEATIVGTVTDPTGAVVPNVTITIMSLDTGLVTTLKTLQDGNYVAADLAIGHYTVKASASGFKVSEKTDVFLNVNDRLRLDFQLQVGGQAQTVTVAANAVHLQTDTGEMSDIISGQDITKLEMNGRSIYTLVSLTPGASSLQGDSQLPISVSGDANVSFNGQRQGHNIYLVDGGEDLDRGSGGTFSIMPSLEALAESRILTSNYSPEYGLSSAGTVVTTFKSGAKQFHGEGWEFFRNNYLDARNYFNPVPQSVAALRYNIFGFNIGGPVSVHPNKSEPKTFFFYNMEWRRFIFGQTLKQLVPLPSTYQGNFAGSGETPAVPCAGLPSAPTLSTAQQARFTNAGLTLSTTNPSTGACEYNSTFPSNQIPSGLLDANAQALLTQGKIFPANTQGTTAANSYYLGGVNQPTDLTEEIVRIDHKFTDKFSVFGHWVAEQVSQTYGTTMWSGDNVPTIGNTFGNPSYSAVVHTTYSINPNVLNEAAFNFDGNRIHILPKAGLGAPLAAPSSFTSNRIFGANNPVPDNVMPTINLNNTGTQYSPNWTPWNNDANDYQIRDDLSWVKGAHQFKFGASWALYSKIQDAFAAPEGNFGFNGFYSNYDFADFLLGLANSYSEDAVHDSGHWDNVSWAAYALDNWRATPRLTLNLGLRWDGVPHAYEINERASDFYPNLYSSSEKATFDSAGNLCSGPTDSPCTAATPGLGPSPNAVLKAAGIQFYLNGVGIGGVTAGVPRGLVNNHWNAWGPRLGLSYDVTGHGKTVVRAGFGMMYERIQGNDMYDDATNVPFDATASFSSVELANPHTSVATGTTLSVPIVVASLTGLDQSNYKLPITNQWSAGVQHQLTSGTLLDVAYVGDLTRHQSDFRETNLPPASLLASLITTPSNYNLDVPYLGFRSIKQAECESNGEYNSLQVDLHTILHKDLQAQFGYTYAHAYDTSTGGGNDYDLDSVTNPYAGWKFDWGPSIFDRHNVAFVNYIYSIPAFRNSSNHAARTLLGGWELAGISFFESGPPITFNLGGTQGSNGVQNGTNRPNLTGTISYPKQHLANGNTQWFSTSAFSTPSLGAWGNLPFNALRGPGRDEWNIALHKIFKFTESANLEFRAETFNIWNHPQWKADDNNGGYGNSLNGGNPGQISSAYDPRIFQVAGKITF